jgi:hypothetical protein
MIYYHNTQSIISDLEGSVFWRWIGYVIDTRKKFENSFLVSSDVITQNEESVIFDALGVIKDSFIVNFSFRHLTEVKRRPDSIIDALARIGGLFAILKFAFVLKLAHMFTF